MLALLDQGIKVDKYVAYEIDKYAVKTATHNFPEIEQRGDVFEADFTEFRNFDYLMGGSPCTYWSIAQKNNRETEASGLGWELFSQYVRALREAQPKYFVYENNKSMSNAIRESITNTFGFEPICINSALLSAQNRQRLYWVGKRNADGTYSRVEIEQPEDRGILLKDILEDGLVEKDKAYCLKHQAGNARDYFKKHHTQIKFESVGFEGFKESNITRVMSKTTNIDSKSNTLTASSYKGLGSDGMTVVAVPIRVGSLPRPNGELSQSQAFRVYDVEGKSVNLTSGGGGAGGKTGLYAVPLKVGEVNGGGQGNRIYSVEGKAVSQTATSGGMGSNTGLYAVPVEFENDIPVKAMSYADGKTYQVYEVKRGFITIKGKEYPIKLADGYYIIRKLTVRECMRLQTVPEWYDFSVVSDTQAYKMLGNGWTVAVISYLLSHTIE